MSVRSRWPAAGRSEAVRPESAVAGAGHHVLDDPGHDLCALAVFLVNEFLVVVEVLEALLPDHGRAAAVLVAADLTHAR